MSWTKITLATALTLATGIGLGVGLAGPQAKSPPAASPPPQAVKTVDAAEVARMKAREAEKNRQQLEETMIEIIHDNSRQRIALKRLVLESQQALDTLQGGLKLLDTFGDHAKARVLLKETGQENANIVKPDKAGDEMLRKYLSRVLDLQVKILSAEEDVRNYDEIAALRLGVLKQRYAAFLRVEAAQWDK